MDTDRDLDASRAFLAVGALAILLSLFFDWFDFGGSGWAVFESLDLVLAVFGITAGLVAWRPRAMPDELRWAPVAALIVVLVQLAEPPPAAAGGDPKTGAWLALAGAILASGGAIMSLANINVRVDLSGRDRPAEAAPKPANADPEATTELPRSDA